MKTKIAVISVVVVLAVALAAGFLLSKPASQTAPTKTSTNGQTTEDLQTLDTQLSDLDAILGPEDSVYDSSLGEIAGDW